MRIFDRQGYSGYSYGQYTRPNKFSKHKPSYQYVKAYRQYCNQPNFKYAASMYERNKRNEAFAACGAITRFLNKLASYIYDGYTRRFRAFWESFPAEYRRALIVSGQGVLYGRVAQAKTAVRMLRPAVVRAAYVHVPSRVGEARKASPARQLYCLPSLPLEYPVALLGLSRRV
jgi:hypothetical protein